MRIVCWNMRRASHRSAAWDLLAEAPPDLALLQEVGEIPESIRREYAVAEAQPVGKRGQPQKFSTVILCRGEIRSPVPLQSRWEWVDRELDYFRGNLLAREVVAAGKTYRVMSVYSPAWPVAAERLHGLDVSEVKLRLNPRIWVTELLWAALLDSGSSPPWIVGGDLNASETFDYLWKGGPSGNREILDRMHALGLRECLRREGPLVPTFRNSRGGKVIHQMDHLFVSEALYSSLGSCSVGSAEVVFGGSLSDHLPIVADLDVGDRGG